MAGRSDISGRLMPYIRDAAFPCSREELLLHTESNYAPDSLIDAIERMPLRLYTNPNDVAAELLSMRSFAAELAEVDRRMVGGRG